MSAAAAPEHAALLVVGAGPAAVAAVEAYRAAGGTGDVRMLGRETALPYFRPALTKDLLRGEAGAGDLALRDGGWAAAHRCDVRLGTSVDALDPGMRTVRLADGTTHGYDRLVLAVGAEAATAGLPGERHPDVQHVRWLADALRLRARVAVAESAVIVGAGFVGCEAAASLARRGLDVTVVEGAPTPHAGPLGVEVGDRVAGWLRGEGVDLRLGVRATGIAGGRTVHLDGEDPVEGDVVLIGGGVAPNVDLARDAGLRCRADRVAVDAAMRTSDPRILAAGDCVHAENAAAGRPLAVVHWGEAETMGAVAGTTAAGGRATWDAVPGFWSEIGDRALKHVAWGDGFDEVRVVDHGAGAFTGWQGAGGRLVGAICHEADDDFARAADLIRSGTPIDDVAPPAVA